MIDSAGLARLAHSFGTGARVGNVRPLRGGTMDPTFALDVTLSDGTVSELVLKQFAPKAKRARDEWDRLVIASDAAVPSPEPVRFAEAGEWFDGRALVMSRLPGAPRTDFGDGLDDLAAALASLHATNVRRLGRFNWRVLPPLGGTPLLDEIGAVLPKVLPQTDDQPKVFLHADFWCGNVLWKDGTISGIVDWSHAARGPRGVDVSYSRLDATIVHGPDAADRLTEAYERITGPVEDLHVWDLFNAGAALLLSKLWFQGYQQLDLAELTLPVVVERIEAFARRALENL